MTILNAFGYKENYENIGNNIFGRVTEVQKDRYTVITDNGELSANLKGSFSHHIKTNSQYPAVGDFVKLIYNTSGVSQITEILPRHTTFSRSDSTYKNTREQIIATNFDYVFIVTSLNNDFNVNRVLRYLSIAYESGGTPVIILTKADLLPEEEIDTYTTQMELAAPEVPVIPISSHTGYNMDRLRNAIKPEETAVIMGMSGVGKSSLLNALMEKEVMTVSGIREDDARGRHTTTHRELFKLPSGAIIIDTPGMREIGLFNVSDGVSKAFSNIESYFEHCKFKNCTHTNEPGCAVLLAIENGELTNKQWEQYNKQRREAMYMEYKSAAVKLRKACGKSIAKEIKNMKKHKKIKY